MGYTITELKQNNNFTTKELKEAGFIKKNFKEAGFTEEELNDLFTPFGTFLNK